MRFTLLIDSFRIVGAFCVFHSDMQEAAVGANAYCVLDSQLWMGLRIAYRVLSIRQSAVDGIAYCVLLLVEYSAYCVLRIRIPY